jgi:hypothetical protein
MLVLPLYTLGPVMQVLGLYTSRCPLQSQNVQKYGSKVCVGIIQFFGEYLAKDRAREKKEGRSSFVLPEITNMCTYIARASGFFFIKKLMSKSWRN